MKHMVVLFSVLTAGLLTLGCAQPAASTPTQASTTSTKAAEPTKAASSVTAASTAQPAAATTAASKAWPEKGKVITIIVPWAAGGACDVQSRLLAPELEKTLGNGVKIQIVNKPGAAGQIGNTEVAKAKPDGYTLGYPDIPAVLSTPLDPERDPTYKPSELQPIAMHAGGPVVLGVITDSPYKTVKDVIDAAKAKPGEITAADCGLMTNAQFTAILFQEITGVKFRNVHIDSSANALTSLLGGHVDMLFNFFGEFVPRVQEGKVRILGIADDKPSEMLPGVKTFAEQGYKINALTTMGLVAPAGTPKEIVAILADAVKKATESPEHQKKMKEAGKLIRYMGTSDYEKYWNQQLEVLGPIVKNARSK